MTTVAQRTIYVPDDLDAKMRATPGISWSAIARRAFAAYLGVEDTSEADLNRQVEAGFETLLTLDKAP